MWEFEIQLHSVQDVQAFVALATAQPFPVRVGNDHYKVSAQSFMEIFCLDLSHPLTATLDCTEEEFLRFRDVAKNFAVK